MGEGVGGSQMVGGAPEVQVVSLVPEVQVVPLVPKVEKVCAAGVRSLNIAACW